MYVIADQLESLVQRRYDRWRQAELPLHLKKELNELKTAEIMDRFYKHLSISVEGVKGRIGVGTNRLNLYTIRRVTQGLADEINNRGYAAQQRGVLVGYDSRYLSRGLAEQAALVLAANHIKAYLFENSKPTAELAFAVRWLHAAAGIIITAGNYSAEYNGCKIYGENGIRLQEEAIERIAHYMESVEDGLKVKAMDADEALRSGRLVLVGSEIEQAYLEYLQHVPISKETNQLMGSSVRIVYTPLQGTGGDTLQMALEQAGFTEVYPVTDQQKPDMFFTQVRQPDPYNPMNLEAAYECAAQSDADLVIAISPEANELSLSIRREPGKYVQLNGNQTAALLLDYMFMRKQNLNQLPSNGIVLKSVLTGDMVNSVVIHYGLQVEEVSAGIRQISRRMAEYDQTASRSFLFGIEEYGGFAVGAFVRDKDAIQASLLAAEMAAYYKSIGMTVYKQMLRLSKQHGWFAEDRIRLSFPGLEGWQRVKLAMQRLRTETPKTAGGLMASKQLDYSKGEQRDLLKGRVVSLECPPSNILKFILEDGSWYAFRQSSTEAAITLYFGSKDMDERTSRHKLSAIRSDVLYNFESFI